MINLKYIVKRKEKDLFYDNNKKKKIKKIKKKITIIDLII